MFGPNMTSTLSLTKVLGGISHILGIANQAIPIYKEIKPMVGNAKKVLNVLKEFNTSNITLNNSSSTKKTIEVEAKEKTASKIPVQSNPTFFQ